MRDVQPFVALKTNEIGAEGGSDGRSKRSLAYARLSLEKERLSQPERDEQRHRKPAVSDVVLPCEQFGELGNGTGENVGPQFTKRPSGSLRRNEHHLDERVSTDGRQADGGTRRKVLRERAAIGLVHVGESAHVGHEQRAVDHITP